MIKTFLLSLVIVGSSLAVYLYFYLGVSKPVDISCEKRGPLNLMFKSHSGAYHEIGETIRAVEPGCRRGPQ